jgi:DNA polymerase iota
VTCNYEARRRGLRKLQLIKEARQICPDVIIVLGEDISRFRDASKTLYHFLRSFSWNDRAERLGFDEVNGLSVPPEFLLMSPIFNRCGLMLLT